MGTNIEKINQPLKVINTFGDFTELREFLEIRSSQSQKDLEILSSEFGVPLKTLLSIRAEIQKLVSDRLRTIEYICSAVHPTIADLFEIILVLVRAVSAVSGTPARICPTVLPEVDSGIAFYPVYYRPSDLDQPHLIRPEDESFLLDLTKLLKLETPVTKEISSSKWHEELIIKLKTSNWKKELQENLDVYLRGIIQGLNFEFTEEAYQWILYRVFRTLERVLSMYQNLFSNFSCSKFEDLDKAVAQLILNYYEDLKPILQNVKLGTEVKGISQRTLEELSQGNKAFTAVYFYLIYCVLGGYQHIGAEYEKLNSIRRSLRLPEIFEPEAYPHRFLLVQVVGDTAGGAVNFKSAPDPFIRLLILEDPLESVRAAALLGEDASAPIEDSKTRERVRVTDFYLNVFQALRKEIQFSYSEFNALITALDLNGRFELPTSGTADSQEKRLYDWVRDLYGNQAEEFWIEFFRRMLDEYRQDRFQSVCDKLLSLRRSVTESCERADNSSSQNAATKLAAILNPAISSSMSTRAICFLEQPAQSMSQFGEIRAVFRFYRSLNARDILYLCLLYEYVDNNNDLALQEALRGLLYPQRPLKAKKSERNVR